MVEDSHSSSTTPAHHQTLEQRRTFPRRTLAGGHSPGLRVLLQAPLVLLEFLPGDISWVSTQDKRVPLFARQSREHSASSLDLFSVSGAAKEIGARVARVA